MKILLLLLLLAPGMAMGAEKTDVSSQTEMAVDLTPAIKIGDFTTSHYLFDKAYQQFAGSSRMEPKPDRPQAIHWLRLYLAQQVIKADLVQQKQLDRSEVIQITERMARYMLTQPQGPLYRKLVNGNLRERIAFRQERRKQILTECRFVAYPEAIEQLWATVAPTLGQGTPFRDVDMASIGPSILAHYFLNNTAKKISVANFAHDFQQGIARTAPRDAKNLEEQIEDMAVTECDWTDALKLQLDQTPQFLEDRHNFALNQALALYEKEVLSKKIILSSPELASYHQTNLLHYSSPTQITGALFLFPDLESARRAMISMQEGRGTGITATPFESIDPFVIQRDASPVFATVSYGLLLSLPVNQRFGPFGYGGRYAVFLKRAVGEIAPIPFALIQDQLRSDLTREKTEAAELEYLSQNSDRIKLFLNLTGYGLEDPLPRLRTNGLQAKAESAQTEGIKPANN